MNTFYMHIPLSKICPTTVIYQLFAYLPTFNLWTGDQNTDTCFMQWSNHYLSLVVRRRCWTIVWNRCLWIRVWNLPNVEWQFKIICCL